MTKQQENRAFVKMLKEFPKAFGRVSFRERLMLRTAFTCVVEEVAGDIKANCDLAIEGRDIKIKELVQETNKLLDVINNQDVKIADLEKQITALEAKNIELSENWRADHDTLVFYDEKLEKENAELRAKYLQATDEGTSFAHLKSLEWKNTKLNNQLTKAKEILKKFIETSNPIYFEEDRQKVKTQAEQFLKEIEK